MLIVYILLGVVIGLYVVQFISNLIFNKKVRHEVEIIYKGIKPGNNDIVMEKDLERLPEPVKKYLSNSGVIGKPRIKTVRLKQDAKIRMSQESRWFRHTTVQYFNTENPGFIWYANMPILAGLSMKVRDKYFRGKGDMLGKLFSVIPIVTGSGFKIDQGSLSRFVGEMTWFPTAFLNDYCKWESRDNYSAVLNINIDNVKVNGIFTFDENYNLKTFECPRWMDIDDKEMKTYMNYFEESKVINGIRIPIRGKAVWKLEKGELIYWDGMITEIEYDNLQQY